MSPRVLFITGPRYGIVRTAAVVRAAGKALGAGRLVVQLRDKDADEAALLAHARVLRDATREVGALFVVNGALDVAKAVRADGVHLPKCTSRDVDEARTTLGDAAFVSTSAHDDDDVERALEADATAILVSPIFASPTKGNGRGVTAIVNARALVDAARQPPAPLVYALGGITGPKSRACLEAGADGVAAIRALYDDPMAFCSP